MILLYAIILFILNLFLILGWYLALKPESDDTYSIVIYSFIILFIDYIAFKDTIDSILFMEV